MQNRGETGAMMSSENKNRLGFSEGNLIVVLDSMDLEPIFVQNEKKEDGEIVVVGVDTRLTTPRSVKETQEGGMSVLNNTKSHKFVGGVTRRTKTLELSLVSNTPLVNS